MSLRVIRPSTDAELLDWQYVHNEIIPTDPLSLDDVRERSGRNRLTVAYDGDTLVGCSTVRPPSDETPAAIVIVRVLPAYRRQGFGEQLYNAELTQAQALSDSVETIVLETNQDGLRFALRHGFVEVERYVLDGATIPYIVLRLS
ncbi:GNAT family N-acetyltransferase [Kribbella sp. CA-294648]|uniref:GNAT family N-acetyltransferase n=1 Tax=Kribbella sp. CA-294648 TaxID=3239948 RepID=UPI003D94DBE1